MTDNLFEIPQSMGDLTGQHFESVGDTMGASIGTTPSPVLKGFKDLRERAMDFAADNAAFAGRICNAKTHEEILTLQSGFTQDRLNAFVTQMQEFQRLLEQATRRPI